jgi:uracil-DNA glycosylase family 4
VALAELTAPRDVSRYDPRRAGARCDLCPLAGSAYVPALEPKGKPRFVIVGEGPGRREEILRTPFVGITGAILNDELEAVRLARDEAFVTNAIMCRGETDQDNDRAAECCAPRLLKELAAIPEDVPILTLGKAATRAVLGVKSILLARGFVWTARDLTASITHAEGAVRKAQKGDKEDVVTETKLRLQIVKGRHALAGRTVLPMLHPTFAFIHNEVWAPIFTIDLDRAARWIRGELNHDMLADRIEQVKSVVELKKRKRVFLVTDNVEQIAQCSEILGPEVACDIETERRRPLTPLLARILCVQVSDGVRGIVIGPWDKRIHADALTRFLKGRTAIFHNGFCFDTPGLERDGVSFEGVNLEDTLTAHHTFASHYPQKLDHVVSTFLDSGPWKIRHGVRGAEEKGLAPQSLEDNDLYLYGGTDAHVTKLAWDALQVDLSTELTVYAHDKRRSVLYKSLQVVGYRVDRRRRRLLSKLLKRRSAALKGRMRLIAGRPAFEPSKLGDVRKVLFGVLRAPMLNPTKTGLAGTSNATLETLRTGGASTLKAGPADTAQTSGPIDSETKQTRVARFSEALLNWRVAAKIKSTYLDAVEVHPDDRAHYTFKPFGVISGRPASRILSAPRWSKALPDRVREIYTASVGCTLVYFDLSQAEMRLAAYLSGDENFIATCKGDVHTANALILFPDAKEMLTLDPKGECCPQHAPGGSARAACNCGKPYRDIAKNAGFAVSYLAEAKTVFAYLRAHGFPVEFQHVEDMLERLHATYVRYYEYVYENVAFVQKNGYLRTAIMGRIVWLGFHPEPAKVANTPIQSGIADIMDLRLLNTIVPQLPQGARMIMHHYDSATFDVPNKHVPRVKEIIEATWKEPVRLEESIVCRRACEFLLPTKVKEGHRWSDF